MFLPVQAGLTAESNDAELLPRRACVILTTYRIDKGRFTHARGNRVAGRRNPAGHKPAEEASLTGIRQSNVLVI